MNWVRQKAGRPARRPVEREIDIQTTCSQLLALDGWRVLITNPCSDRSRGKGFGEVGMADALYIRYRPYQVTLETTPRAVALSGAQAMWIEWKGLRGRVADHQRTWHQAERAGGALTMIAGIDFPASIDGFWAFYRKSGLMQADIHLGALDR